MRLAFRASTLSRASDRFLSFIVEVTLGFQPASYEQCPVHLSRLRTLLGRAVPDRAGARPYPRRARSRLQIGFAMFAIRN